MGFSNKIQLHLKKMHYALNFNRNKFRFKRERILSNTSNELPKKRQIIINEKIDYDRDFLIEKYYYIYELSQQFNMEPALMFNFSDDGALSINIGNYYGYF